MSYCQNVLMTLATVILLGLFIDHVKGEDVCGASATGSALFCFQGEHCCTHVPKKCCSNSEFCGGDNCVHFAIVVVPILIVIAVLVVIGCYCYCKKKAAGCLCICC